MFNGRRQPSNDGTSRMTRECQVRFCERLGVKFPGPTRRSRHQGGVTHLGSRALEFAAMHNANLTVFSYQMERIAIERVPAA